MGVSVLKHPHHHPIFLAKVYYRLVLAIRIYYRMTVSNKKIQTPVRAKSWLRPCALRSLVGATWLLTVSIDFSLKENSRLTPGVSIAIGTSKIRLKTLHSFSVFQLVHHLPRYCNSSGGARVGWGHRALPGAHAMKNGYLSTFFVLKLFLTISIWHPQKTFHAPWVKTLALPPRISSIETTGRQSIGTREIPRRTQSVA